MSIEIDWDEALEYVQQKVPKQVFDTWFLPVQFDRAENSTVYLGVPNKFFGEWLETHYGALLTEAVAIASGGEPLTVTFIVRERATASPTEPPSSPQGGKGQSPPKPRRGILLNPKYTFRNFVVGAGNQFAHAACMAVAEQPGQTYNPLFIYGGVGLGKTHLLNAIGNHVAEQ